MAGNVQSNIHINVTSNVQDTIRNFSTQFNLINGIVDSCLNDPFSVTEQKIHQINSGIVQLSSTLLGMEGLIPESQFEGALNFVTQLRENASQLVNPNAFIDLGDITDLTDDLSDFNTSFLRLDLSENIDKLTTKIKEFISTGNLNSETLGKLAKEFGIVTVAVKTFKEITKVGKEQMDEFLADMEKAGDIISNAFDYGVDLSVDSINNLIGTIENLIQKSYELAESGVAIQNGYFTLFNYLGEEAGKEVVDFTEDLKELYGLNPDNLVGGLRGILGMVSNMGLEAEKATQVVEAFTMFGQDLSAFSGYDVNEVVGQLESAVNLGSIRITSPIIRALDLTKEDVQAFRELNSVQERANFLLEKGEKVRGTYEKWLQTAGGKIEIFRTSLENLNSNLSKLFTGLYAKVAPILTDLVNMLSWCVESIAKVFNIDLKEAEANVAGDYYEKVASGIDSVAESADKAKRKVASFDDVIQINDDGSAGGLGESFGFDPSMLGNWTDLPEKELTDFQKALERIKELLADGKFNQAGRELAQMLNSWLTDIDWDGIKSKLEWAGLDLAKFLNSLFENARVAGTIGTTLAESINSVFSFLLGFGRNFNFGQFGVSAGTLWDSFWDDLDASDIGETFYEYILGGFEFLDGFLSEGRLSDATSKISEIIIEFFSNFDEDDILLMANTVINLIDSVFVGVAELITNLKEHPEIKEKLELFIRKLIEGLDANSAEWGETANSLVTGILDLIGIVLNDEKNMAGLSSAIEQFIEKLDPVNIMIKWWRLKQNAKNAEISALGSTFIEMIIVGIGLAIQSLLENLSNWYYEILDWCLQGIASLGVNLQELTLTIMSAIVAIVGTNLLNIADLFLPDDMVARGKEWLQGLLTGIQEAWEGIKTWWNNNVAGSLGLKLPDGPIGAGIKATLKAWGIDAMKITIPQLATGGIINRATLAMVGEDGAEAVVPLERNLGWIDKLSTSIANKINSGSGNGGNITISLEEISKPFYTRSEMLDFAEHVVNCLKIYGVNVAIVN